MNDNQSSYRQIFKATSLFGGVQVFNILLQIVKQKFIAVILGPSGMGISGLYTSATSLIQGLTSIGLSSSAVKNVAEANSTGDIQTISRILTILNKLVWITGIIGMIVVIVLSPFLSKSTFGNYDYTFSFIFLSITLLFQQLSTGQLVVLQGMRKLKQLATSSVLGSFFGLIISVPIYYFFGIQGIVPTLILSTLTNLILTWIFSRKIKIINTKITSKQTIIEGRNMIKMGLVMTLSNVLVLGSAYLVRIFIIRFGGTEEVGLYTAGFAVVNGYVGLIFSAMGTDYYPRLAGVNNDNEKCKDMINQQAEIAVLIIAPIIMIFLIIAPFAITLLYSSKFLSMTGFMQWAMFGMIFKAVSWSIAFLFIAKGEMKLYAINETIANFYGLIINIIFYYIFGLDGLGIAFALSYFIYLIHYFWLANKFFSFKFIPSFEKILFLQLILIIPCFLLAYIEVPKFGFIVAILLTIACIIFSIKELDNRIKLFTLINSIIKNKK